MIPNTNKRCFQSLALFLLAMGLITGSGSARSGFMYEPAECKSDAAASATESAAKYADKGEHEKALQEYLRAVRLEGSCAAVYHNLGTGYAALERHTEALAAFQKALEFKRSWSWATVLQIGRSYAALGCLDDALNAYNAVLKVRPNESAAYRSRARLYLRSGKGNLAVADAKSYLKIEGWSDENSIYVVLVEYLGLRQTKQTEAAKKLLDEAQSKAKKNTWPFSIIKYFRQELKEDELLALATDVGKMTEARTYIGLDLSLLGKTDDALAHLNWVKQNGKKSYVEYGFALSELDRIEREQK